MDEFKTNNFNNKSMQANKLTNVVENTNPLTPKFIGDSSPQGLAPPIRNQSKNRFSNIAIVDILNGVLASSMPQKTLTKRLNHEKKTCKNQIAKQAVPYSPSNP